MPPVETEVLTIACHVMPSGLLALSPPFSISGTSFLIPSILAILNGMLVDINITYP